MLMMTLYQTITASSYMHGFFLALLKKILRLSPTKRYTIEMIKNNIWIRKYVGTFVCNIFFTLTLCLINPL